MKNAQPYILVVTILLMGGVLLVLGPLPVAGAAEKLTDTEMYKMESGTKDFIIDLIAAGVWTKDSDEFKQFNKYDPKAKLNIPKYNEKKEDFEKETFPLTGAEYRRILVSAKAFASYNELDKDGQKRVNMEFFGQETKPERGTTKYNAGIDKAKNLIYIILGEGLVAAPKSTE